jgi:hypothetical protein
VAQFIQTLAREAWWLMNIELRCLWLDYPSRDRAQFTVSTDDGDDLLAAAGYMALPDSDDLPVIRVVPVADRDLFTVL